MKELSDLLPLMDEVNRLQAILDSGRAMQARGEQIVKDNISAFVAAQNRLSEAVNKFRQDRARGTS